MEAADFITGGLDGQVDRKDRETMTRHFDRSCTELPLELVATSGVVKIRQPASSIDVSKGGLKVRTRPVLVPGQQFEVFLRGVIKHYAVCKVVWAHTRGRNLPSVAGLEIVEESPPEEESASDFLAELRGAYHNPASIAVRIAKKIDFLTRSA